MPRGSKPGERRGGRQRGTPNKKTVLRDAVFCAGAAQSHVSPLDFMLGLMRDPKVPTDLRIEMAVAAAPFVHAKRQASAPVHTSPNPGPAGPSSISTAYLMEDQLSGPVQAGDAVELSPLSFLLGVMKDRDATPKQQIKAARIAVRYKHVPLPPQKMPSVDEYGFSMSRSLVKAIFDDWWRLHVIESGRLGPESAKYVEESAQIRARQDERDKFLQAPPGYSSARDWKRQNELADKKWRSKLSMAEMTEFAYVTARITASEAAFNKTPEGRASRRIGELNARQRMRTLGGAKALEWTAGEESELEQLYQVVPSHRPDPTRMQSIIDYAMKVVAEHRAARAAKTSSDATLVSGSPATKLPDTPGKAFPSDRDAIRPRYGFGWPDA